MLNFRCLIALQILLTLLVGVPLYFGLDFSGQTLQSKFPQVKPEEAQALARLLAGSYASLGLAVLGFLLPGRWSYRQKVAASFCLANLVSAAFVLRDHGAFTDPWFLHALLFTHFLLAVGFGLNTLDSDRRDELPGTDWFSFPNVLTFLLAGVCLFTIFGVSSGVGSFTRYPGRTSFLLGSAMAGLTGSLFLLVVVSFVARLFGRDEPDGEEQIRRQLLRQLGQTAAQEERNRLARDLHDSIKQQLFTIHLGVATARERWERDPAGARDRLDDIARSAKEALVEMRALLQQLSPHAVASVGLIEALREQCEALGYRTGARVDFEIGEPLPEDRLPPKTQESLFRIVQEALSNVARHARAEHVRVALGRQGDTAVLEIEDDGRGFEPGQEPRGLGLRNMEERADELGGSCRLRSEPGTGTALTVIIPFVSQAPVREDKKVLHGALATHDLLVWLLGCLLGLAAVNLVAWTGLPPAAVAIPYFALLGGALATALLVSRRGRSRLARPDAGEPALAALDHRVRAWFSVAALVQCFWLAGLLEARTPGGVLWAATATLLAVWAGWELFRFHRSTSFRGWRALHWTKGTFGIGTAAFAAFLLVRRLPDPEPATFAFLGLAAVLLIHTELRRIPTPPC